MLFDRATCYGTMMMSDTYMKHD